MDEKQKEKEKHLENLIKIKLEESLIKQKEDLEKIYQQKQKLRMEEMEDPENLHQYKQKLRMEEMEDLEKLYQQKQKLRLEQMKDLEKIFQLKQKLRLMFITEIKKNSKLIKIELKYFENNYLPEKENGKKIEKNITKKYN